MTDKNMREAFEREERYIVIKRKHLDDAAESSLRGVIDGLDLPTIECVVVEEDWPIYEQTWDAVQRLAEGRPQAIDELRQTHQAQGEAQPLGYVMPRDLRYSSVHFPTKLYPNKDIASHVGGEEAVSVYLHPPAPEAVPEGYALIPNKLRLTSNELDAITWLCGGCEPDGADPNERFTEGTLWVGAALDDDGNEHWGLHIHSSDYPEEGCLTLAHFDKPTAHTTDSEDSWKTSTIEGLDASDLITRDQMQALCNTLWDEAIVPPPSPPPFGLLIIVPAMIAAAIIATLIIW